MMVSKSIAALIWIDGQERKLGIRKKKLRRYGIEHSHFNIPKRSISMKGPSKHSVVISCAFFFELNLLSSL